VIGVFGVLRRSSLLGKGLFLKKEAQFAGRAVGAEAVGEVEGSSGAGRHGGIGAKSTEGQEAGGLVEAETGAESASGGTEDAAAHGGVEGAKAIEFDGDGGFAGGGADGAATSADRFAGKKELGEDAG
jgi:hypothetical protein